MIEASVEELLCLIGTQQVQIVKLTARLIELEDQLGLRDKEKKEDAG